MSDRSEVSFQEARAPSACLQGDNLTRDKETIFSNIFSELAESEAGGELVLGRSRFLELFPMPQQASEAVYRGFCGCDGDHLGITRDRFLAGIQALIAGGTANRVRLLFGGRQVLSRDFLEAVLKDVLEGFHPVVSQRALSGERPLPEFATRALHDRTRQIVDEIISQSKSREDDQVSLTELTSYVRSHPELKGMIRMLCRNTGSFPGYESKEGVDVSAFRDTLQQMIESGRHKDAAVQEWKCCNSAVDLPSLNLEASVHDVSTAVKDAPDSSSSTSSSLSAYLANPLPLPSPSSSQVAKIVKEFAENHSCAEIRSDASSDDSIPSANRCPGLFKLCQNCEMSIEVRFCVECGTQLRKRGPFLGCEKCAADAIRLRYKFCARCGSRNLLDHSMGLIPSSTSHLISDVYLRRRSRPRKGIRGFVTGDLQEWFYVFDAYTEQWNACWALVSVPFLLLFKRVQVPHPYRIISLQGRRLEIEEYHGEHDEYMINISPCDDGQDDGCMIVTTDQQIGNRWLQQMRKGTRRRAVEDYYTVGEYVFKLPGLVERCVCRDKLSREKFLITLLDKAVFDEQEIKKIRSEFALFKLLRHPALIAVKDVFESEKQFSVVVPQLSGGYLMKSLHLKGHFDESVVRLVIYPVVNALVRLHRAGLDLINIRPECLMVTPYAQHLVQIAHLDLNKFLSPSEVVQRGLPKRLLSYRAPEALHSGGPTWVWGPAVDMWAVGILMFELLTGELPFEPMPDDFIDFSKNLEEKFQTGEVWNSVSSEAKDVIRALLRTDRDQRPSADVLLDNSWFSIRL